MTSPRVSVIVPVFNTAPWVAEAIASLQAQTLPDFEVLVIDDGSGDGAGDVAAQAMGADPRFRLIRQAHGGLSRARNRGLDAARGSVIAFLDSDDRFHPDFLQRMVATLDRTGARWAACGIDLLYPGSCIAHSGVHGRNPPNGLIALDDAVEVGRILPSAWNKIYRRDLFRDLRFRPGALFEDHEVFWTLAQRAGPLAYRDEALVQHRRMRPGQITACAGDGAFAVFDVLERLRGLIASGCFAHASAGFARLATRLVHERLAVIGDPLRRERFVAAASRWFRHSAVDFDDGGDPWISAALKLSLAGEVPLCVILAPGAHPPTGAGWPHMHVHHWPPPHPLPGRFAMILGPGQSADAMAVQAAIRQLLAMGADMMVGAYRQSEGVHDGWTVATQPKLDAALSGSQQGASIHPFLGNLVLDSWLLDACARPGRLDACSVQDLVLELGAKAQRIARMADIVCEGPRSPWPGRSPAQVARWARARPGSRAARARLFLRMVASGRADWRQIIRAAWRHGLLFPTPEQSAPRWVRACLLGGFNTRRLIGSRGGR